MKNIRIGNDIIIGWALYDVLGNPYQLKKEFKLSLKCGNYSLDITDYTVEDNKVTFTFYGKDQTVTGVYTLTLIENDDEVGMHTVDCCKVFRMVNTSCESNDYNAINPEVESLDLHSKIDYFPPVTIDKELSSISENPVQNKVITSKINKIDEDITSINGEVEIIKEDITSINGEVEIIKEDITSINGEVEIIKEDITSINGEVEIIKEDITSINGEVEIIKEDITSINGEVEIIKEDITSINDDINNINNNITQLDTELNKTIVDAIAKEKAALVNGDTIVGQAREIHSRNGKTVTDSFLARTTAGSGTIGDGVASLKSVGGNIVKNLVDFSKGVSNPNASITFTNGVLKMTPITEGKIFGTAFQTTIISGHKYYGCCTIYIPLEDTVVLFPTGAGAISVRKQGLLFVSHLTAGEQYKVSVIRIGNSNNLPQNNVCYIFNYTLIDLTEMFGAGNEPTKEECDRLFGTMDALPQGLTIAKPTEFKSTGFNQFNPNNVLDGKAIVDNAIVSGDKKIAVIPCLPCKVGTGENNGYCIHGEFGDDIKVYLTPLNPMEVDGELYMHELTKDATTDTYVPQIKGYMLVEVPTTANLCAHFLWSEDKCDRDSYEPYFESKIELPAIPQMSEYGLAGIQSSGTLACDEIDFERGVYIKRVGAVDLGSLTWKRSTVSGVFFAAVDDMLSGYAPSGTLGVGGYCANYTTVIKNYGSFANIPDKCIIYGSTITGARSSIVIQDLAYDNVNTFVNSIKGNIAYYELATPEEYPLPKVDNNYISSDYGVEQFDSVVPCNANNLYYMRSLAGETRNFLDRMYYNTDKSDANEVADYITSGIEENKELATNAPNLALRALYVAAGAEYNDTGTDVTKTAPWGETVTHKAGHYYLNGLGDITEEQMIEIYNAGRVIHNVPGIYNNNKKIRTNLPALHATGNGYSGNIDGRGMFVGCTMLEVAILSANKNFNDRITVTSNSAQYVFFNCNKVRYISRLSLDGGTSTTYMFRLCSSLSHVEIRKLSTDLSFSDSPLIDKESILYLIQNNNAKSTITITLHPDAYNRLANDADIVAALEAQPLITLVSA